MTLGPTVYTKLVSAVTRRSKHMKAPKSRIPEYFKTSGPLLSVASVKTRFKAFCYICFRKIACDLGFAAYERFELSNKYNSEICIHIIHIYLAYI